ncbi:10499_t:CDS:1, partial [Dentiscutata heterogama]
LDDFVISQKIGALLTLKRNIVGWLWNNNCPKDIEQSFCMSAIIKFDHYTLKIAALSD